MIDDVKRGLGEQQLVKERTFNRIVPARAKHLHGAEPRAERDAYDAQIVVAAGRDDTSDGGAVIVATLTWSVVNRLTAVHLPVDDRLQRRIVACDEVGAGVRPLSLSVLIEHTNPDTRAGVVVPYLHDVDVDAGCAPRLPDVLKIPLEKKQRIIGRHAALPHFPICPKGRPGSFQNDGATKS